MKRVAVGQLLQETNSLSPRQPRLADFAAYGLAEGEEVMACYGQVGELAGFAALPELAGEDVEWVGLVRAAAWSGGMLAEGVLDRLIGRAVESLRGIQVDGVLFSLHGAQAGEATEVLTEKTGPGSSPQLYESVGLDPRRFKIVVAKSPEGFRRDYEPFAAGIL